jgi:hypothetical protein
MVTHKVGSDSSDSRIGTDRGKFMSTRSTVRGRQMSIRSSAPIILAGTDKSNAHVYAAVEVIVVRDGLSAAGSGLRRRH